MIIAKQRMKNAPSACRSSLTTRGGSSPLSRGSWERHDGRQGSGYSAEEHEDREKGRGVEPAGGEGAEQKGTGRHPGGEEAVGDVQLLAVLTPWSFAMTIPGGRRRSASLRRRKRTRPSDLDGIRGYKEQREGGKGPSSRRSR